MNVTPTRIAITGACGQIAYSLIFRIASGALFDGPLILQLGDIPGMEEKLEGIAMELMDCDFPLLQDVVISTDLRKVFQDVDVALLVGAKPRSKGMERKDLLAENGKIFVKQGKLLNEVASRDVLVYVVGNPANTNALVAMHNAPDLPRKNFHALMRLDHNRARAMLAQKAKVPSLLVKQMVIWGNHSNTQVPDFTHVLIDGKKAVDVIGDLDWFKKSFMPTIQTRGAKVIEKLGRSSAASAANAAIEAVRSLHTKTAKGDCFSSAVCSDGNSYGIEEGLIFGFPCVSKGKGDYEIVENLLWDDFIRDLVKKTEKELIDEREYCKQAGLI